jgi:hypothetical protein
MKRMIVIAAALGALVYAGSAVAALSPWTFDPGNTGCPSSTFSNGVLHLVKNCVTTTNASAGATITGVSGQTFASGSFTLASASQCQGGSPRFNVVTTVGTFFLGCNNVSPTINTNGTATYNFTAANGFLNGVQTTITGTITSVDVLIDVQGIADLSNIMVNGVTEVPAAKTPSLKDQCKHGGWKSFTSPSYKNQGQCVSHFAHVEAAQHSHASSHSDKNS